MLLHPHKARLDLSKNLIGSFLHCPGVKDNTRYRVMDNMTHSL